MSEHMPGPWRVGLGSESVYAKNHATVCDIVGFGTDEGEANARLIAAAPTMRAFIEKVANTHSTHWLAAEAVALLRAMDGAPASGEQREPAS